MSNVPKYSTGLTDLDRVKDRWLPIILMTAVSVVSNWGLNERWKGRIEERVYSNVDTLNEIKGMLNRVDDKLSARGDH